MNLSFAQSELEVLDILAQCGGSLRTLGIVHLFQDKRKNTPKQTVYRALSALKKKEVITVAKGFTTVNTHWIGHMRILLDQFESKSKFADLPEKISYTFPSLWSLAPTWTHYVNVLISQSDKNLPIIFINPHQWFYLARAWSESQLIDSIQKNGHFLWQGITYNEKLDKEIIKQKFSSNEKVQGYIVDEPGLEKNLYVNVIGDYVITVSTTDSFTREINKWYTENTTVSDESVADLQEIIKNSGKVKIVIQKNNKKASQYRKSLGKYFYIPKK